MNPDRPYEHLILGAARLQQRINEAGYGDPCDAEIKRLRQRLADAESAQAELDRLRRVEIERLRVALADAVDLAEEGWAYAGDYFREKWNVEERLKALGSDIAQDALRAPDSR